MIGSIGCARYFLPVNIGRNRHIRYQKKKKAMKNFLK